jgi:transcriptional regulator with GAF, ATPase, and Fis domain
VDDAMRLPRLIAQDAFPWSAARILKGEIVSFATVDELPPEAAVDRATLLKVGPKSNLSFPLVSGDDVLGALTFGTMRVERQWPVELRERLAVVAHVFANALARKRSDLELRAANAELRRLKDQLEIDNQYLRQELGAATSDDAIVAQSEGMKRVLREIRRVAATESTVMLYGETGTGKELLAEAVHNGSRRKHRLLVRVNCAALPASLIESELFGREKGAYTGALSREIGRFETADGGTLFLDEVGELPLELQVKLLRVLETGTFERLGSSRSVKVDVRLIAATNRDLDEAVREGRFREDLFFRLQVFPVHIPSLRERREDIPPLVWTFVKQFGQRLGKLIENVPRQSMASLQAYHWPGNVRELRNVIERSMILTDGPTLRVTLPEPSAAEAALESAITLEELERRHVLDMLERTGWRVSGPDGAARILGVRPTTLEYRMKKLGISRKRATDRPPE